MSEQMPVPADPVRVALIGAGARSRTVYLPLFEALAPWVRPVAVCDPWEPNRTAVAEALGVPGFADPQALARAGVAEVAIVATPIASHHALGMFCCEHGLHNLIETSWCSLLAQGRELAAAARERGVVARVAENFVRFPIDRFAALVRDDGCIGPIRRVVSYADHTGYHNDSRWIAFAGAHPRWAQSLEHAMETVPFASLPDRRHRDERFRACFFGFPEGLLVADLAANIKGFLGRHPRPGYTEWQGARGTLVHAAGSGTELRRLSDAALAEERSHPDQAAPVEHVFEGQDWLESRCRIDGRELAHVNPFRHGRVLRCYPDRDLLHEPYYGAAIMDLVADFACAVRGLRASEIDEADALAALEMDVACRESALRDGARIALPLAGDLASEERRRAALRDELGVDPMDVEAMLALTYEPV